jgi:hypothetical protein
VSLSTVTESAETPANVTLAVVSEGENWKPVPFNTIVFGSDIVYELKFGKFPLDNEVYEHSGLASL